MCVCVFAVMSLIADLRLYRPRNPSDAQRRGGSRFVRLITAAPTFRGLHTDGASVCRNGGLISALTMPSQDSRIRGDDPLSAGGAKEARDRAHAMAGSFSARKVNTSGSGAVSV